MGDWDLVVDVVLVLAFTDSIGQGRLVDVAGVGAADPVIGRDKGVLNQS